VETFANGGGDQGFDRPSALLQSLVDEAVETVLGAVDQADQESPASNGDA
jgi:hypothetical protein